MPARGDSRILELLDDALGRGPKDVLQILDALRSRAAKLLGHHEGRIHPMLHDLLRKGYLHVAAYGANGLAHYALGKGGGEASPAAPADAPAAGRQAARMASAVRGDAARNRIARDIDAHRASLSKKGTPGAFGAARNVRHMLRRVDRGRAAVFFPAGGGDYVRKFAVEEGPWILTAVVAFLVIRAFFAEVFFIPSSSMVPTLLEGDRVVVTKPGAKGNVPERWSIVTFDRARTTFVKRVVGLGGESILLYGGDPYIDGKLLPHPDDLREDLRAPYRTWDLASEVPEWNTESAGDVRVLEYGGPTLWSGGYDEHGRTFAPRDVPLRDVYAILDGHRPDGGELAVELAYASPDDGSVSMRYELTADDRGVALRVATPQGVEREERISQNPRQGDLRLELAYVDGGVRVAATGVGLTVFDMEGAQRPRFGDVVRPRIRYGGRVGAQARASRFQLDKDHHYTLVGNRAVPPRESDEDPMTYAHAIPEGTVFLLGDNSYSSKDCRFDEVGDIGLDQLIGPVVFRIWPPLRIGGVR